MPPLRSKLRRFFPVFAVVILLGAVAYPYLKETLFPPPEDSIAWRTDYKAAVAESKATGKPLILDFTASWCPPCQQMKRNVFPTPAVRDAINAGFIPVQLDVDRDEVKPIAANFQVQAIPSLFIITPGSAAVKSAHLMTSDEILIFLKH